MQLSDILKHSMTGSGISVSDDIVYVCERLHVVDENDEVFVGIHALAIYKFG